MQMAMFDPRECPTATAEMLADRDLRGAIAAMRRRYHSKITAWPYVESIEGSVKAWAVDDSGMRYVVAGVMAFDLDELAIMNRKTRVAALAVFERLDAQVST